MDSKNRLKALTLSKACVVKLQFTFSNFCMCVSLYFATCTISVTYFRPGKKCFFEPQHKYSKSYCSKSLKT